MLNASKLYYIGCQSFSKFNPSKKKWSIILHIMLFWQTTRELFCVRQLKILPETCLTYFIAWYSDTLNKKQHTPQKIFMNCYNKKKFKMLKFLNRKANTRRWRDEHIKKWVSKWHGTVHTASKIKRKKSQETRQEQWIPTSTKTHFH